MTHLATTLTSLSLDPGLAPKLQRFRDLLLRWNQSINLSAARSGDDIEEHIRDSLHVVAHVQAVGRVVDVGAGGGFPAVVVAICLPAVSVTAIEPVRKKHAFLRTAARELDLVNFEALPIRVEDHATRDYDAAMSRATFDLREWILLGADLVRADGLVLGFEATRRDDLPQPIARHSYELDGKQRAIVAYRRSR